MARPRIFSKCSGNRLTCSRVIWTVFIHADLAESSMSSSLGARMLRVLSTSAFGRREVGCRENGAETWPFTRINTTHAQPAMMTTLSVLIQNCRAIRGRPRLESNQWMPDARGYVRSRGSDQLPPLPSVYKSSPTGRKTGFLGQLLLPLTRSDVLAVTRVVEAVFAEPDEEEKKGIATPLKGISDGGIVKEWEPFGEPKLFSLARSNVSYRFNGRDGQI